MKIATAMIAAIALMSATTLVSARSTTPSKTPGHLAQQKGSLKGSPGASGYTPGHRMQAARSSSSLKGSSKGGPGASSFAPGHETTGSGTSTRR